MAQVFISHSKRDVAAVQAMLNVFARTQVRAVLAEFENYQTPPWSQIREWVRQSSAAFVLLSPHLHGTAYTQNWVAYEVGLACGLNKPVWVYEQWNNPASFPIPYLTEYVVYDPSDQNQLNSIKQLVENYDPSSMVVGAVIVGLAGALISGGAGAGAGAMIGAALGRKDIKGFMIQCPHHSCGIRFRIHNQLESFPCPSCRQIIHVSWK